MISFSSLFLTPSNAVTLWRDKSAPFIIKTIALFLLLLLSLNLLLYSVSTYIFSWHGFSLYLSLAIILLLRIIDYTNNLYYINKTKLEAKSYLRKNNTLEVIFHIALYLCSLTIEVRRILVLLMSPLSILLSPIIKGIIINTFTSGPFYKAVKSAYYKGGLYLLLHNLCTYTYYKTAYYLHHNLYYMLVFQCICIYQATLGYDIWLTISLTHIVIHLPFFTISIVTSITIINRDFYKKHCLLLWLNIGVCVILLLLFIFLSVILYGSISSLTGGYSVQTKGPESGSDSGSSWDGWKPGPPGPTPRGESSHAADQSRKKGKEKENKDSTNFEKTSHVNIAGAEFVDEFRKIDADESLDKHQKKSRVIQIHNKMKDQSSKSSSSADAERILDKGRSTADHMDRVLHSNDLDEGARKNIVGELILDQDKVINGRDRAASYRKKHIRNHHPSIDEAIAKTNNEGIKKDTTSPNLNAYIKSNKLGTNTGLDGSSDVTPVRQASKTPRNTSDDSPQVETTWTYAQEVGPDTNPLSTQQQNVYSPPNTPSRKRDRVKKWLGR